MKQLILVANLTFLIFIGYAQTKIPPAPELTNSGLEEQLESAVSENGDSEIEDDYYLQEIMQRTINPLDINIINFEALNALKILSPVQISNFFLYRSFLGKFANIYEVQAIPGWTIQLIKKLLPFITVTPERDLNNTLRSRLSKGEWSLLLRGQHIFEIAEGYKGDTSGSANLYTGSREKIFVRFKYQYKNLLQYGFTGEKDPGEQFFRGAEKRGFDFYSFHLFLKNAGTVKALALGDFTVNIGQGLLQWMGLAFNKSADILSVMRQGEILKPYNSAGEVNFHRGVGLTLSKSKWEATLFASAKNIDANLLAVDTVSNLQEYITSLQTSGLHRTSGEINDRGGQRQTAYGGNITFHTSMLTLGLNLIDYNFKFPFSQSSNPYSKYNFTGTTLLGESFNYNYTFQNIHSFGEVALSNKGRATLNGILVSVAGNIDLSFLYRNISPSFRSLYSNAFTESSSPSNESGLFSAINLRAGTSWTLAGYVDLFKFPWLKYRADRPGSGNEFLFQVNYKPNKILEIYTRLKYKTASGNVNFDNFPLNQVNQLTLQSWRTQFVFKLSKKLVLRSRIESVLYNKNYDDLSKGSLASFDIIYTSIFSRLSGNLRIEHFDTDDYNSRLYNFENDVLYSYSIPVLYGQGFRYYVNLNYDFSKHMSLWVKTSQISYPEQVSVGTALEKIYKSHKTEVKFQIMYKF